MPDEDARWSDVFFQEEPEPTVSYRSRLAVYEESLTRGRFVGRGWNAAGFISFYDGRIDPLLDPTPQAFWLEMDGHLLGSHWVWDGVERPPIPEGQAVAVALRHTVRPVAVKVHTRLDGTAVLTRWLEVTNAGSEPAALSAAFPWSGLLQRTHRWRSHLGGTGRPLYSIGYFEHARWGTEGAFRWFDLPAAGYRIDGRYHRERHRHPLVVIRNNATGEHFILQIAWSGGYLVELNLNPEVAGPGAAEPAAILSFRAGPDAPAPLRVIDPGETVLTPEVHLGLVMGDLDSAIQEMHEHLRTSVFLPQPRGHGGWLESGIGPEIEITTEQVHHAIDTAADLGAEVFFIDASWYSRPRANWFSTVGDWEVQRARFPGGLEPVRRRVHEKGRLWGLWMEPERLGTESRAFREHQDWLVHAYDGEQRPEGLIDLGIPEAARWVEEQIVKVIDSHQCDFFRLDYNTQPGVSTVRQRGAFLENATWRYYESLYAIFDRLRTRYPQVIFENCAGGGGRTDIGMVRRFSHTWVTDWQIAPRSFAITNGMTMALPPEHVDRLLGGQSGHITAELDFQSRLLLFVRPTFGFLHPRGAVPNPIMGERTREWIRLYREFVRPYLSPGRIYHHTPEVDGLEPQGWGVLELCSRDRSRGICGLFQLSAPTEPDYVLRLRGLDAGRRYRVRWGNSGRTSVLDGFVLMHQGLTIRLEGALTSELLVFEPVE